MALGKIRAALRNWRDRPVVLEIDEEAATTIINSYDPANVHHVTETGGYEPTGRFYYREKDGTYVGIDNSTGDAWTEEFTSKRKCIRWLRGGDYDGCR